MHYIPVIIFVLFLCGSWLSGLTPALVPVYYCLLSIITFIAYAKDKRAARLEQWRVSEGTLHVLSLLGGWPGAIVAQQLFRHKTRKTEFRIVFWLTLLTNTGAFIWLHSQEGFANMRAVTTHLERVVMLEVENNQVRATLLTLLQF